MPTTTPSRRHALLQLTGITLGLAGCHDAPPPSEHAMPSTQRQIFDVALFSYLDRPIFDVFANGRWVGGASEYGGGQGLITGVSFPLGAQKVTWRLDGPKGMARNGETVQAANTVELRPTPPALRYLGIHIYPDNTVEYLASDDWPHRTERGEVISRAAGHAYGR